MLVSIVIATYNSENTVRQCLDSIVAQNYKEIEVIIKDGASTDMTLKIIDEYSGKLKLNLETSNDGGVYDAWNQALSKCSGQWLTFLGSDDYFVDEYALSSVVSYLLQAENSGCHLVYGKNEIIDLDGNYINELGIPWGLAKKQIYQKMSIRHPGSFVTRNLIDLIGGFDSDFKIIGDYDFVLCCVNKTPFLYYSFSAVTHRIGGLSISPKRSLKVIKETFRLRKKHKLSPVLLLDLLLFKRLLLYVMSLFINDNNIMKIISKIKK